MSDSKKAAHNVAEIARRLIAEDLEGQIEQQLSKNLARMKKGGQTLFTVTVTGLHKHEKVETTVCNATGSRRVDGSEVG